MMETLFGWVLDLPAVWKIILLIVMVVGGLFALIKGADAFVDGACGIANRLKIPAIIIGLTIVSIGTSLPETAVSVTAVTQGSSEIAISNVVGSNIANILLVLGATFCISKVVCDKKMCLRDIFVMIASGLILLAFALINITGHGSVRISRIEALILLVLFIAYIVYVVIVARKSMKQNSESENAGNVQNQENGGTAEKVEEKQLPMWKIILLLVVGLLGVFLGGEFVVFGAQHFAVSVGMSETLVGLTIVAVGTSSPELVTSIVAAKKGSTGLALGNIIGSNIYNILFILGLAGLVGPISISTNTIIDICVMIGVMVLFSILFFVYANKNKQMFRGVGITFLAIYAVYLTYIILRDFVFV